MLRARECFEGALMTTATGDRRSRQRATVADRLSKAEAQIVRLDHALLVVGLQIADQLWDQPDQLARDVGDVLLAQLALLSPRGRHAERRLHLRPAVLAILLLPVLAVLLLRLHPARERVLAPLLADAAMEGGVLQLRLA